MSITNDYSLNKVTNSIPEIQRNQTSLSKEGLLFSEKPLCENKASSLYDLKSKIFALPSTVANGLSYTVEGIKSLATGFFSPIVTFFQPPIVVFHSSYSTGSEHKTYLYGIEIPHYDEALKISLHDFNEMNEQDKKFTLTRFKLQSEIDAFGGNEIFFHKLNNSNKKALESTSLVDLVMHDKLNFKPNPVGTYPGSINLEYILLNSEEFKFLNLNKLKDASQRDIKILSKILEDLREKTELAELSEKNIVEIPIVQFGGLSGLELNEYIHLIPAQFFPFLSNEQLKEINFALISEKQIKKNFIENRFDILSANQLQDVLDKLDKDQLKSIPDQQLQNLDLTKLSKEHLNSLLDYSLNSECLKGEGIELLTNLLNDLGKSRINLISSDQLIAVFDKLDEEHLNRISNEQLQKMDMSKLSEKQVNILFPAWSKETISEELNRDYPATFSFINGKFTWKTKATEEEIDKASLRIKNNNTSRLKGLSNSQIEDIKNKVAKENLELINEIIQFREHFN